MDPQRSGLRDRQRSWARERESRFRISTMTSPCHRKILWKEQSSQNSERKAGRLLWFLPRHRCPAFYSGQCPVGNKIPDGLFVQLFDLLQFGTDQLLRCLGTAARKQQSQKEKKDIPYFFHKRLLMRRSGWKSQAAEHADRTKLQEKDQRQAITERGMPCFVVEQVHTGNRTGRAAREWQ